MGGTTLRPGVRNDFSFCVGPSFPSQVVLSRKIQIQSLRRVTLNDISRNNLTTNTRTQRLYVVIRIRVTIRRPLQLMFVRRVVRTHGALIDVVHTIIRTDHQKINRRRISTTRVVNLTPRFTRATTRFPFHVLRTILPIVMTSTTTRSRGTRTLPRVRTIIRAGTSTEFVFPMATIIITISVRSKHDHGIHGVFRVLLQRVPTKGSRISTFRVFTNAMIPRYFEKRVQGYGGFRVNLLHSLST